MYNNFKYTVVKCIKGYDDDVIYSYIHCSAEDVKNRIRGYKDFDGNGRIFERKGSKFYYRVYVEPNAISTNK